MATQSPQAPQPSTIKVSIKADTHGGINVESSHPLPNLASIVAQFSPAQRALTKKAGIYNGLDYVIKQTSSAISFQEWTDAIAAVLSRQQDNKKGAVTEVNGAQSALILVGDTLYKMSPQRIIAPSKMLVEARKVILERAKDQAQYSVDAAKLTAAGIIRDANKQREEVERTLAVVRNEISKHPPMWAMESGVPLRYIRDGWQVGFSMKIQLSRFDIEYDKPGSGGRKTTFSWTANPIPAKDYRVWVPLRPDGSYEITSVRLESGNIPHMNSGGACMAPADNPDRVNSTVTYNQLAASVVRCNQRVQLNSLYNSGSYWMADYKDAFPPDLYAAIARHWDWSAAIALAEAHNPPVTSAAEERRSLWTA